MAGSGVVGESVRVVFCSFAVLPLGLRFCRWFVSCEGLVFFVCARCLTVSLYDLSAVGFFVLCSFLSFFLLRVECDTSLDRVLCRVLPDGDPS